MNERRVNCWLVPFAGALGLCFILAGLGIAGGDAVRQKGKIKQYPVEVKKNIAYYQAKDADKVKHKLDLYLPKGKAKFPVVLFVHGGAWIFGDKRFFGGYYEKQKFGVVHTADPKTLPGKKYFAWGNGPVQHELTENVYD